MTSGDERRIAKSVVDEFNNLWADALGYHVELVGWEDTISGYGRPQATINRDLERCEFFIGIMWKRWGTPPDISGPYTSGFEEEFTISVCSRQKTGRPEISLLFKDVDDELLRDPGEELKKVIAFKDKIVSEKVILFETFGDPQEFERRIRRCVSSYVQGLQAKEATELSGESQTRPSDNNPPQSVIDKTATETPFSAEGVKFLQEFVAKTERETEDNASFTPVQVARFRLLASIIKREPNDMHSLGVHDSNILFANRCAFTLGRQEVFGLISSGLDHFSSENTPLWHWYAAVNGFTQKNWLLLYSVISKSTERRISALSAMRLISEPLFPEPPFDRETCVRLWFSEDAPNALKAEALGYLGEHGLTVDLPALKQELDRADYQTRSAAIDAIIRVNLRDSREKGILALYELQPESVNRSILRALFGNGAVIRTDILSQGVEHRSPQVRRIVVKLLRKRGALKVESAERLTADEDARVRFEALQSLISGGRSFSDHDAKNILVKPLKRGYGLGGLGGFSGIATDSVGEAGWKRFREQKIAALTDHDLENAAANENWVFEPDARFILFDRQFSKRGDDLRTSVDDHFKAEFSEALREVEALEKVMRDSGKVSGLAEKTKTLDESIRKDLTRKGLDVICRKGDPQDLGRVRSILKNGFINYSDTDVEYLRKFGEWEDITLIVTLIDRPDSNNRPNLLSSFSDDSKYRNAARAIYTIGRARLAELLSLPMPSRLLSHVIVQSSDKGFHALNDSTISPLLLSEHQEVRKATALKCVRSLPKSRLRTILQDYISGDQQRYYNVVHWLDLGVSAPRDRAVIAAEKAIAKGWRE